MLFANLFGEMAFVCRISPCLFTYTFDFSDCTLCVCFEFFSSFTKCLSQSSSECNENFRSQDSSNYDIPILKNMVTEQILGLLRVEMLIVAKVPSR